MNKSIILPKPGDFFAITNNHTAIILQASDTQITYRPYDKTKGKLKPDAAIPTLLFFEKLKPTKL